MVSVVVVISAVIGLKLIGLTMPRVSGSPIVNVRKIITTPIAQISSTRLYFSSYSKCMKNSATREALIVAIPTASGTWSASIGTYAAEIVIAVRTIKAIQTP